GNPLVGEQRLHHPLLPFPLLAVAGQQAVAEQVPDLLEPLAGLAVGVGRPGEHVVSSLRAEYGVGLDAVLPDATGEPHDVAELPLRPLHGAERVVAEVEEGPDDRCALRARWHGANDPVLLSRNRLDRHDRPPRLARRPWRILTPLNDTSIDVSIAKS